MDCCSMWLSQILCFLFAFLFFQVSSSLLSFLSSPSSLCVPEHSSALLQFKNSLSISRSSELCRDAYPKTESWNRSTDCCSWDGVTCHRGRVIGLDLSCSPLKGSLSSNSSLFLLQDLQWLNLAYLDFEGYQIPSEFSNLRSLTHLDLSHTGIYGLFAEQISLLSELVSLDVASTSLVLTNHHFNIILHNLTKLETLFLDLVEMSLVTPNSFLNLTSSLKNLSLYRCQLQGRFPSEVFSLPYLEQIILRDNEDLNAYLPKSNWSTHLRLLDLSGTSSSGELPDSIGNLVNLEKLSLSSCRFTGSIPSSLGNLTKLTFLDLSSNNFEGQIPDVFGNLNKLNILEFSSNNFHGLLPSSAFNLTGLIFMDLRNNHIGGPLPYNISGLSNLKELQLSENLLNGRVPGWLFSLPSLQLLDLESNKLTGPMDSILKPNLINSVDLSNNEINGPIPSSFFDLVNLASLGLSSNNLSGNIQSCMISKLRNLELLNLSNNSLLSLSRCSNHVNVTVPQLRGLSFSSCNIHQFPSFLREWKNLEDLDLSNNKFQGSISKWEAEGWESLRSLDLSSNLLTTVEQFPGKSLVSLDLRSNLLQGPLPTPPGTIQYLFISKNELTGEIPSGFCNLFFPQVLDLSKNKLSGIIPICLGSYSSLSVLDLRMNSFHGKIPILCAGEGPLLRSLNLNDNQLEGSIPRSSVNCSDLEVLDLGNNNLNDSFPHWLGVLPKLKILVLRSNKFHGSIPNLRGASLFTSLRIIDLSRNEFSGNLPTHFFQNFNAMRNIPDGSAGQGYIGDFHYQDSMILTIKGLVIEFQKILKIFTTIDFSNNQFEGQVSEVVGELKDLLVLNFSHNRLTGQIPSSLGNLSALEALDLSSNKIEGTIPMELTNLIFLEVLNLSQNNLVGSIPQGNQFNTFTNDSYEGNPGLCGFPLSKEYGNHEEPESPLDEDDDYSRAQNWKSAMMGYGCGLVFGLSMGYIAFTTGKPRWLVKTIEGAPNRKVRRQIQKARGIRRNNQKQPIP